MKKGNFSLPTNDNGPGHPQQLDQVAACLDLSSQQGLDGAGLPGGNLGEFLKSGRKPGGRLRCGPVLDFDGAFFTSRSWYCFGKTLSRFL